MSTHKRLLLTLCAVFGAISIAYAQDEPNWVLYSFGQGTAILFSKSDTLTLSNGHLEVPLEVLPVSELGKLVLENKDNESRIARIKQKIAGGYSPPMAALPTFPAFVAQAAKDGTPVENLRFIIVVAEDAANEGAIPPEAQGRFELDCEGRTLQQLRMKRKGSPDVAGLGKALTIAPNSPAENLRVLACAGPGK
jgi:hypothetical protein